VFGYIMKKLKHTYRQISYANGCYNYIVHSHGSCIIYSILWYTNFVHIFMTWINNIQ